jgi:hypothetical protein
MGSKMTTTQYHDKLQLQDYLDWLFPPNVVLNKKECDEANKELVKRRLDYESHKRGFDCAMAYQAERVQKLVEALERIALNDVFIASYQDEYHLSKKQAREALAEFRDLK